MNYTIKFTEITNQMTINDLKAYSINQVSEMYRSGTISEALTEEYIELWNRGPHYTKAQLSDGVIRNYLVRHRGQPK